MFVGRDEDAGRDDAEAASRRDVLAKLGRFAYVAPAMMLLAEPGLAHAAYGRPTPTPRPPILPHRP